MGLPENEKKIPYPKSVFFIISNEFCERFNYYGMRTILSLYLTDILFYSETDAKVIYHAFTMFVYFFPVFGAMLADSMLGKFKTILYVSCVYAVGAIVLAMAATPPLNFPNKEITMVGLFLIALGTGGIKPCVSAFGGDQFKLPEQAADLAKFFSMFYFAINAGSLISTAITPILREDVHCFGDESCFSLAFAVPGVLMIISIFIFAFGKSLYIIKEPEGNMVIKVSKCIGNAIKTKWNSNQKKGHWLDFAEEKYGTKLVNEVKSLLKVLLLYLPLPVFWALFDQQGTGWTFMARRMDGDIGFYTILPDQLQVINPLLILAFIPLFEYGIYPALTKCRILRTPLQRLVAGGVLASISFVISALISLALENTYPTLPSSGNAQIRIYNGLPCDISISAVNISETPFEIAQRHHYTNIDLSVNGRVEYDFMMSSCKSNFSGKFNIRESKSEGFFFNTSNSVIYFRDDVEKNENGKPNIRTLVSLGEYFNGPVKIEFKDKSGKSEIALYSDDLELKEINPGEYDVTIAKVFKFKTEVYLGGVYTLMVTAKSATEFDHKLIEVTEPNSIHMLWLLPQYVIITMGEIMFSITGLEFSYSQAPSSMKSVLQACWLLTTAFGNLIVVIIESAKIFEDQSATFFLYAALMLADMGVFALMAMKYKYVKKDEFADINDIIDLETKQNGIDNAAFKNDEVLTK